MTDSIIKSIRAIAEFLIILLTYRQIFNANIIKNKFKLVVVGVPMGICYFLNSYFDLNMFFTIIGTLYAVLIPLVLLEGNKKKWLCLYPTLMLMTTMMSMAISYAMATILNISVRNVYYSTGLSCLVDAIYLLILLIDYWYIKKKPARREINIKISIPVYMIMTVGELIFIVILATMQHFVKLHRVESNIVNFIGFVISFICVVYGLAFLFLSVYMQKNSEMQNDKDMLNLYVTEQQKHIRLMVEKTQDMKKFRHDVRQHMWVISYHIEQGELDLAKEYINQIYENMDSTRMEHYTRVVPIDVVLSDKKEIMDQKKIVFNWSGSVNKIPGNIKEYDICTVFIAILDRAINACEVLSEDEREIKLLVEINNGKLYIMEKHKCKNKNIKYEDRKIKAIAEKYDGYVIQTVDDDSYMVEVVL
ncbi:MAG: GHKL domain-containing protein [Lachnospiraceae bacterium]|nr:GHKL domain-containing protein [Lachnospiraceae bacterium]